MSALAELKVIFSAESAKLRAEISAVRGDVHKFSEDVEHAISKVKGIFALGVFGEGAEKIFEAGKAIGEFIKQGAEAAHHTEMLSEAVGSTVEDFSRLQFAFGALGADIDRSATGILAFEKKLVAAKTAGSTANAIFKAMGYSQEEIARMADGPLKDALLSIAGKFASYEKNANRAALGSYLFAKGAKTIVPALAGGPEALEKLMQVSDQVGNTLTHSTAEGAKELIKQTKIIDGVVTGFRNTLTAEMLPAIEEMANDFRSAATEGEGLKQTAKDVAEALRLMLAMAKVALAFTGDAFSGLAATLRAARSAARGDGEGVGRELAHGLANQGVLSWTINAARNIWASFTAEHKDGAKRSGHELGEALAEGAAEGAGKRKRRRAADHVASAHEAAAEAVAGGKTNAPSVPDEEAMKSARERIAKHLESLRERIAKASGGTKSEMDAFRERLRAGVGDIAKDLEKLGPEGVDLGKRLRTAIGGVETAEGIKKVRDLVADLTAKLDAARAGGGELARVQAELSKPEMARALRDGAQAARSQAGAALGLASALDEVNASKALETSIVRLDEALAALAPEASNVEKFLAHLKDPEVAKQLESVGDAAAAYYVGVGSTKAAALDSAIASKRLGESLEALADDLVTAGAEGTKYGEIEAKIERGKLGREIRAQGDAAKYTAAQFRAMALALDAAETRKSIRSNRETFDAQRARLRREFEAGELSPAQYARALEKAKQDFESAGGDMTAFTKNLSDEMASTLAEGLDKGFKRGARGMLESWAETLRRMVLQALSAKLMMAVFNGTPLGSAANWLGYNVGGGGLPGDAGIGNGSSPGGTMVAGGGPVTPGRPYVVGERGPEVFIAPVAGQIVPAGSRQPAPALGAAGPSTLVVKFEDRHLHMTFREAVEGWLADERARR